VLWFSLIRQKSRPRNHKHKTNPHQGADRMVRNNLILRLNWADTTHLLLDQLSSFTMTVGVPVTVPNLFSKSV